MKQKIIITLEVVILYAALGYAVFTSEWLYAGECTGLFITICILGVISFVALITGIFFLKSEE